MAKENIYDKSIRMIQEEVVGILESGDYDLEQAKTLETLSKISKSNKESLFGKTLSKKEEVGAVQLTFKFPEV